MKPRRSLLRLAQRATSYPPPATSGVEAATSLRGALEGWLEAAVRRFDAFFLYGRPQRARRQERAWFRAFVDAGLAQPRALGVYVPCARVFLYDGLWIATDLLTHASPDQVFSLMFEQVYLMRNMSVGASDDVLEVCTGSGVNAIFAARQARRVTGVDISPRALAFARFNETLNPGGSEAPVEWLEGSLFEPLGDRCFDRILINPPFEPAPESATYFLHSDGGIDGLDLLRTFLEQAPRHLNRAGRIEIITWSPGGAEGPVLPGLVQEALPEAAVSVHALWVSEIDVHLDAFRSAPDFDAWRAALAARGATTLHFLFVRADLAGPAGLTFERPDVETSRCRAIADPWL